MIEMLIYYFNFIQQGTLSKLEQRLNVFYSYLEAIWENYPNTAQPSLQIYHMHHLKQADSILLDQIVFIVLFHSICKQISLPFKSMGENESLPALRFTRFHASLEVQWRLRISTIPLYGTFSGERQAHFPVYISAFFI